MLFLDLSLASYYLLSYTSSWHFSGYLWLLLDLRLLKNKEFVLVVQSLSCVWLLQFHAKSLQHSRLPCPSLPPRVCCLLSVGEDSWESLGLQGDQTSQSQRKSILNIHWKDWCWSSNALATWCEEPTHEDPDAWKDWRQEEKGMTEDEMEGWHHWLNGHEFKQALGDGQGHGSLVCCSP